MKVTGFRYLTERDATLGWLWCRSDGSGYQLDDFLYEVFFSPVRMPMRHDSLHFTYSLKNLLDARWYFEICSNIF